MTSHTRVRARIEGTVQGVGFRPFVYRLAREEGVSGHVFNDAHGVVVEVEADDARVGRFLERLGVEAPPLAVLERIATRRMAPTGAHGFSILASPDGPEAADVPVSPDVATCDACLAELRDPADRRYRYPFVNCTDCGPRLTIVRGVPYDRALTTMAAFVMCERCQAEYDDPADRRFHAQPNACPACGPRVRLAGAPEAADPVRAAANTLLAGAILAVKGIGGYHLACRAADEEAVSRLRARKHRAEKPFALLAADVAAAERLVELDAGDEERLCGPARPIVLAPRRPDAPVAGAVAPGARELGVMLPYSPLHHLLAADCGEPLVLTSGNVSDEPIAFRDDDARERLAGIADGFLVHDRAIETRTDDSVVRGRRVLRRSRGMVPAAIALPVPAARPILACGADLKSTFCLARGERAWVSHHVGDLEEYEALRAYRDGIDHFRRLFAVQPEVVAHDLHPGYHATQHALSLEGVDLVGVQHHHAHLAACLAEHGEHGPAVGAIFDGTGDGGDGTVWGGELLVGDLAGFARAGALHPVPLPGGEQAVRQPWRMAAAWLAAALDDAAPALPEALEGVVDGDAWLSVCALAERGTASPTTTSMGRLFDAVAALCGIRATVTYEGQAAIELEAAAAPGRHGGYPLALRDDGELLVLDARETVRAVLDDQARGTSIGVIAARFHAGIAAATADACAAVASRHGHDVVVLSGGVFQNRLLLDRAEATLRARGLRVLVPERLPVNDGGISFGQAAVAAVRCA